LNEFAPIIIPTLNRYEHLKRCIESLKNNMFASETDLYISVDYPPAEKYVEGYNRVKEYLDNELKSGFKNIYVFYQSENLGPEKNMDFLRNASLKSSDKTFIFCEDDNEFAPCFLEYINKGLKLFEDDDRVCYICSYSQDKNWDDCEGANIYYLDHMCAWGYGTWRKKFDELNSWISERELKTVIKDLKKCRWLYNYSYKKYWILAEALIAQGKNVFISSVTNDIRRIDYTIGLYLTLNGKYSVFPRKSLTRNWGYDGSGTNCAAVKNTKTSAADISEVKFGEFVLPAKDGVSKANSELNNSASEKKRADKAKIIRRAYLLFGKQFGYRVNELLLYLDEKKYRFFKKFGR